MGARYARAANKVMPEKLDLATRRVLVAMALRVLDHKLRDTEPGVFYGGRLMLLNDLGTPANRTSYRHLSAALAELVKLGLLERVAPAAPRQAAVYRLVLPVDNSRQQMSG